jgi:hypothetical protein
MPWSCWLAGLLRSCLYRKSNPNELTAQFSETVGQRLVHSYIIAFTLASDRYYDVLPLAWRGAVDGASD